jgi:acetyltransferase-like isoleucine patch superfamily enzyme
MSAMPKPLIKAISGRAPELHVDSWVAPNATVIGPVTLGAKASVWYGAILRAEFEPITVGEGSNLQDNVTVHVDPGFPAAIGAGVSVGHNAVLHGCTVEDGCLVGMGAVVLNGRIAGRGGRGRPTRSRHPAAIAGGGRARQGAPRAQRRRGGSQPHQRTGLRAPE